MYKKFSIIKLMFFCLITTIVVVELTFSRYATTLSKESNSVVAVMANDVEIDIVTPENLYPGSDAAIVAITLTNEDNGKLCDVSQKYTLSVGRENLVNIPLEISLCKDEDCTDVLISDNNGIYSDSSFSFNAGVKEEKKYYLRIYWPEEYNDASYAFEVDYFKILVNAVQID